MEYIALGSMSGTSLDGIDLSIIKSNGLDSFQEIDNLFEPYSADLKTEIHRVITDGYLLNPNLPTLISNEYLNSIDKIITRNKSLNIDILGIHGQTVFHDEALKISLQIFNKKVITDSYPFMVSNFRKNDLLNGGCGAPIIPIFHQLLSDKFQIDNCVFANIGGVTNITIIKKEMIKAYDLCFGNSLSDDLIKVHNKKYSYDKDGIYSSDGLINQDLEKLIYSDDFFRKDTPKTLDRNYFHKYFNDLKNYSNLSLGNTLYTLWNILSSEIIKHSHNSQVILCGGGRKNNTLIKILKSRHKNITDIDEFGLNGDFIESQGMAYLAIRRFLKIPSTFKGTTGISKEVYLGEIN